MRNRKFNLKLMLALPVVAMLAIPGAAKQVADIDAAVMVATTAPQSAFGLFLDPHAEPILSYEAPASAVML